MYLWLVKSGTAQRIESRRQTVEAMKARDEVILPQEASGPRDGNTVLSKAAG
jgi:hypothetical protein